MYYLIFFFLNYLVLIIISTYSKLKNIYILRRKQYLAFSTEEVQWFKEQYPGYKLEIDGIGSE